MQARNTSVDFPRLPPGCTLIFGCIVGSQAYGTAILGSDVDKKWIFVQSAIDFFINGKREQINISKDEVAYELSRFLELCQKANPTMLELLWIPEDCVLYTHRTWVEIEEIRNSFLTKECRLSFGGYAIAQISKAKGLEKKMNWEKERFERKSILDFCYWLSDVTDSKLDAKFLSMPIKNHYKNDMLKEMGLSAVPHTKNLYNLFWDPRYNFKGIFQDEFTSNDVSISEVPANAACIGLLYFNKDAYQLHCRETLEYQKWLKERNALRYVEIENHQQQIDGKNMMHCVRLIQTAVDIATFGRLIVRRPNAGYLKEIRAGKHSLERIITECQSGIDSLDVMFALSSLPNVFKDANLVKTANFTVRNRLHQTDVMGLLPSVF